MKIRYKYSLISDVGNLRKNNEDNFFVFGEENRNPKNNIYSCNGEFVNEKAFFCVCDGMGGHSAGEVASYIATHQVQKNYNSITDKIKFEKDVSNVMKSFISSINDSIYNITEEKPELKSMGTTLTGIYFLKDGAYAINIGDSRVYELENEKLQQLTIDHTDADNKHALTRFLGMSYQYGNVYPDVSAKKINLGLKKRFLLCSDGLTDMVDDSMIRDILIEEKNNINAANKLVETAKKNGGRDNITVLIVDAEPVNKFNAVLKNKLTICIIIAAVLVGAGLGCFNVYRSQTSGISLNDLSNDIKNAKDLSEACEKMNQYIDNAINNAKSYDDYTNTVDESDNNVAGKNKEFKDAIQALNVSIEDVKKKYDDIVNNSESDEQTKKNDITNLINSNDIQKNIDLCEGKKAELNNALDDWHKRNEEANRHSQSQSQSNNGNKGDSQAPVKNSTTSSGSSSSNSSGSVKQSTSGSRSNGSTSNNNTSTHKNNTSSENGASSDIGTSVSESEDTSGDSQTEQSIGKSSYDGLGGE